MTAKVDFPTVQKGWRDGEFATLRCMYDALANLSCERYNLGESGC